MSGENLVKFLLRDAVSERALRLLGLLGLG